MRLHTVDSNGCKRPTNTTFKTFTEFMSDMKKNPSQYTAGWGYTIIDEKPILKLTETTIFSVLTVNPEDKEITDDSNE